MRRLLLRILQALLLRGGFRALDGSDSDSDSGDSDSGGSDSGGSDAGVMGSDLSSGEDTYSDSGTSGRRRVRRTRFGQYDDGPNAENLSPDDYRDIPGR